MEKELKSISPEDSLEGKQVQVQWLQGKRDKVIDHEPILNTFIDEMHHLAGISGCEHVENAASQLKAKYHALVLFSKELLIQWVSVPCGMISTFVEAWSLSFICLHRGISIFQEGVLNDHETYDKDFLDMVCVLTALEEQCKSGQFVKDPQEELQHDRYKLDLLMTQGEKLFPNTSAVGRDKIRSELRLLKDRYVKFLLLFPS